MSETAAQGDELIADLEEAMRDVVDPELGINVVDLGLVYGLNVEKGEARRRGVDRHDADLGGLSADRRHRGSVAHRAGRRRARERNQDQLGVESAVGTGQDHRGRPRAATGPRLHRLRFARPSRSIGFRSRYGSARLIPRPAYGLPLLPVPIDDPDSGRGRIGRDGSPDRAARSPPQRRVATARCRARCHDSPMSWQRDTPVGRIDPAGVTEHRPHRCRSAVAFGATITAAVFMVLANMNRLVGRPRSQAIDCWLAPRTAEAAYPATTGGDHLRPRELGAFGTTRADTSASKCRTNSRRTSSIDHRLGPFRRAVWPACGTAGSDASADGLLRPIGEPRCVLVPRPDSRRRRSAPSSTPRPRQPPRQHPARLAFATTPAMTNALHGLQPGTNRRLTLFTHAG